MQGRRVLAKTGQNHVAELGCRKLYLAFALRHNGGFHLRVIRRREGERKPEAEPVVAQFDAGEHLEIHANGLVRTNIADRQIHHAVAVLASQSREGAVRDALFVSFDGLLGLPQLGVRFEALASNPECAQGRVARQNKRIDRLQRFVFPERKAC